MALNLAPSFEGIIERVYIASGDVAQYSVVVADGETADGMNPAAAAPSAATDIPLGIAQHSASAGETLRVRVQGESYAIANGAFSVGDQLTLDSADGKVGTATATRRVVGIALDEATAADEILVVSLDLKSVAP